MDFILDVKAVAVASVRPVNVMKTENCVFEISVKDIACLYGAVNKYTEAKQSGEEGALDAALAGLHCQVKAANKSLSGQRQKIADSTLASLYERLQAAGTSMLEGSAEIPVLEEVVSLAATGKIEAGFTEIMTDMLPVTEM